MTTMQELIHAIRCIDNSLIQISKDIDRINMRVAMLEDKTKDNIEVKNSDIVAIKTQVNKIDGMLNVALRHISNRAFGLSDS